jgi:Fervidolysin N-terminal prodomain
MPSNAARSTRKFRPSAALILLLLAWSNAAQADQRGASASDPSHVPAEVLVELAADLPDETVAALAKRLRLDRIASVPAGDINVWRWRIPDRRSVPAVIRSLKAQPVVLTAQANYRYGLQAGTPESGEPPRSSDAPRGQ